VTNGTGKVVPYAAGAASFDGKDAASVTFSLGWGAPFAAAVLAAIPSPGRCLPVARGIQVAELMTKLVELRDAGVLSEEFQAKKAELLSRL
jgi:hypothetical protein